MINANDVKVDAYESTWRNNFFSGIPRGVRLTHVPTGVTITCESERSQHANKAKAWAELELALGAMTDGDYKTVGEQIKERQALVAQSVHQFRKVGCSDWHDGHADRGDGRGPYEERTLYSAPRPPAFTESDQQLATFYNAKTYPDLVRAQEHHIHQLQVALSKARPQDKVAVTPLRIA